jgi:hypothetical protein
MFLFLADQEKTSGNAACGLALLTHSYPIIGSIQKYLNRKDVMVDTPLSDLIKSGRSWGGGFKLRTVQHEYKSQVHSFPRRDLMTM